MSKNSRGSKREQGAATLIMTVILIMINTLIVIFAANYGIMLEKVTANQGRNNQALTACEAGLAYGIAYLQGNSATVLASPSGGYINYTTSSTSLANGSSYTINYTNPTANNYDVIRVTATGRSDDTSSTRVSSVVVGKLSSYPPNGITSVGNVILTGGSSITNTGTNKNIMTGGTLTINNGAQTFTSSGVSSYQGHLVSDVQQNASALTGMTEANFFPYIFGRTKAQVQASAGYTYTNAPAGGDYSMTLSGKTGTTIWINQTNGSTVTLGSGVTVGSAANPVILVVQGNLNIANGVTFYGFIYASGTVNLAGGAAIRGNVASASTVTISNGTNAVAYQTYTSLNVGSSGFIAVPGSWKDF